MKKIVFLIAAMLLVTTGASAELIVLNESEELTVRESNRMQWDIVKNDKYTERIEVEYYFLDQDWKIIPVRTRTGLHTWECINAEEDDPATPYDDRTCFDEIYRAKGSAIGANEELGEKQKALIWAKFRSAKLKKQNNNGTFLTKDQQQ